MNFFLYLLFPAFFSIGVPVVNYITHSYSHGFVLAAISAHATYRLRINYKIFMYSAVAVLAVLLHMQFTSGFHSKGFLSVFPLVYCSVIYYSIGTVILENKFRPILKIASQTFIFVTVLAILSYSVFIMSGSSIYLNASKPCFPFNEPSHFALFLAPLVYFMCPRLNIRNKLAMVALLTFCSFYLQSLIFALYAILLIFLIVSEANLFASILVSTVALFVYFAADYLMFDSYAINRIDQLFITDTINMSALVYLQGLESARNVLADNINGIGFQYLGFDAPNRIGLLIKAQSGQFVNRQDGGFFFAKAFSEFGIWFLLILIPLIVFLYRAYAKLKSREPVVAKSVAFVYASLLVPMYVRDVGYFSYSLAYFFMATGILMACHNYDDQTALETHRHI